MKKHLLLCVAFWASILTPLLGARLEVLAPYSHFLCVYRVQVQLDPGEVVPAGGFMQIVLGENRLCIYLSAGSEQVLLPI